MATATASSVRWSRSKLSWGRSASTARKSKRTRYHGRFARNLLKIWPALFTFVKVSGVEPTNNAAEHSLRGPVIHRKLSHGTHSADGERFVERALLASVTCRLQGRSLFAYMTELLTARSAGSRFRRSLSTGTERLQKVCDLRGLY